MAEIQEELKSQGIKLVTISVDPEHDTSSVLSEYATRFKAIDGMWFFLTGKKEEIWNLIQNGFQLGIGEPTPEDLKNGAEPVMHSNRFVLIDQKGQIRGYHDTSDAPKMKQLIDDAKILSKAGTSLRDR